MENNQFSPVAEFKLILLGIDGVGKTRYANKFKRSQEPHSTENYEITPVTFITTIGPVKLNIWDAKNAESFEKCKDEFLLGADCVIILFDLTNRKSYKAIPTLHKEVIQRKADAAIVLAGNKIDNPDKTVKPKNILYHRKKNLRYYDISLKANYQVEKPLLSLLRAVTNQPNLEFVEVPALGFPEVTMTPEFIKEFEKQREEVDNMSILFEDDDDDY